MRKSLLGLVLCFSLPLAAQNSPNPYSGDDDETLADQGTAPASAPGDRPATLKMSDTKPVEMDGPPVSPENLAKAQKFCKLTESCNKSHPGKAAYCLKTDLKDSGMLNHILEGDRAKDMSRFLRRDGFVDLEMGLKDFKSLPDGSILVLDAHDPLKDKRPACPKVYGNVVVKCGDRWLDDQKYELNFHMKRGCRTKGIWVKPELIPPKPKPKAPPAP